jgi:hypothetical protein
MFFLARRKISHSLKTWGQSSTCRQWIQSPPALLPNSYALFVCVAFHTTANVWRPAPYDEGCSIVALSLSVHDIQEGFVFMKASIMDQRSQAATRRRRRTNEIGYYWFLLKRLHLFFSGHPLAFMVWKS